MEAISQREPASENSPLVQCRIVLWYNRGAQRIPGSFFIHFVSWMGRIIRFPNTFDQFVHQPLETLILIPALIP